MSKKTLDDWLNTLNQDKIDLGLARVKQVHQNLSLKPKQTITVAGTNGKGSTVAILSALLQGQGKTVGTFTSPHIFKYNERFCINGTPVSDDVIVAAFERITDAQADISLSYFEYAFLIACCVFDSKEVDVQVMEVGLGGRLDAVNVLDADAAIITSVDIDHVDWLGNDKETIGKEKAGVLRTDQVATFGSMDCPKSVVKYAQEISCDLHILNRDYQIKLLNDSFEYLGAELKLNPVARPNLQGDWQIQNAAAAINTLSRLGYGLNQKDVSDSLQKIHLQGRLETISESPSVIADVAHNFQSAHALAAWLNQNPISGQTRAVFSVLKDKQLETWLPTFDGLIDHWFVFQLQGDRASPLKDLKITMADHVGLLSCFSSPKEAYDLAKRCTQAEDRLLVFGSFHVLDEVLSAE
ncbi:bifunctional folylpolyglutamate synthase/dihydrofolate synthase [Marinicella rhabdoformis]|uniref:bifunctional folylpolyglutamate synthase/dihydrofolate synthase n=1 Tax=Marinicella rhabdoformis TaxID=2580566 RepID=UPI0012AEB675|nr:folylpolyglutamate synthase/dihydrofolate synthase family protein [Marinicella rhabdoformis]